MKIKIGEPSKIFYFSLEIKNGEVDLLWVIERYKVLENGGKNVKRWLWLCYHNAQHDKRVWHKAKGKYHFCLQIPNVIEFDTAYSGKKLFGRVNLTRLFKKDYHVYSNQDGVTCNSGCME
jgi:hypothetical protein